MKALTVKLPWAWLIIHGGKDIENRNWPTERRGEIAIHCSKAIEASEYQAAEEMIGEMFPGLQVPSLEAMKVFTGRIIGTVNLVNCVSHSQSPWFVGGYGFVLESPRAIKEPVAHRGSLGFWDVFAEEARMVTEQLEAEL